MIDLEPKYIAQIKKILANDIPNVTVWVYGSRIKGTSHEGSDLDLVVMDDKKNISLEHISRLREKFSESNLPILVDILTWSAIPEEFKNEIQKTHEIFQEPHK